MTLRKCEPDSVLAAAEILKSGKIAILPTDTVYGFSGVAFCEKYAFHTEKLIAQIKGRAEEKPLIELIANPRDVYNYTDSKLPEEIFSKWPGALTIIIENNAYYRELTGRKTTAFRCPGDEWLRKVIALCGAPLYSTSVNRSAKPVLFNIEEIRAEFERDAALIVDDGDKAGAKPSTIVSFLDGRVEVLRQGTVAVSRGSSRD